MPDHDSHWATWGQHPPELSEASWRFLRRRLGVGGPGTRPAAPPPEHLPSALDPPSCARLAEVIGEEAVRTDEPSRLRHAGGQSYLDLRARRTGAVNTFFDAVLSPSSSETVAPLLARCSEMDIAVVPFGGATSVVGGLEPLRGDHRAVVALDLSRLDRIRQLHREDLLVSVEAGLSGARLESHLSGLGLTLGHFPQSFERGSLGGYAATRSAGQASTGYGRFDDLVAGLRVATPVGAIVLPAQPSSAAGPDLRRLFLGSEGLFGVITQLDLRLHRAPEERRREGWFFRDWDAGLSAVRELAQVGGAPDIVRLSDPVETAMAGKLSADPGVARKALAGYLRVRGGGRACLLIVGVEGDREDVRYRSRRAGRLLRRCGGRRLGRRVGRAWEHSRYTAPYLRDALLDGGVLAETLETAALWRELPALHQAVCTALRDSFGGQALVGAHVSHVYRTGASLYFTVLASEPTAAGSVWPAAKQAANAAIVACGATITHHHGVGLAHSAWLGAEDGALGLGVLRQVKAALDPSGILNPGKLLPQEAR